MKAVYGFVGLPLVLNGCVDVGGVDPDPSDIAVTTTASVYRWDDVANGAGLTIDATLSNNGTREYYARLGDGFNFAEEQSQLYVANGSDAYLERSESAEWVAAERATLIEGVGVVVLRPGGSYLLMAYVTGPRITGVFRLRVEYDRDADGAEAAGESVSNSFEIR